MVMSVIDNKRQQYGVAMLGNAMTTGKNVLLTRTSYDKALNLPIGEASLATRST